MLDTETYLTGYRNSRSALKEETLDRTMWRNRLEDALDLSFDRLLMMMMMMYACIFM